MTVSSDFKISPKHKASQWLSLNLTSKDSADWTAAINIFEDRIKGRFLEQIDALSSNKNKSVKLFSGFAIIALDCLLIETLSQFRKGVKRTGKGEDVKMFHEFFAMCDGLKSFFDSIDKTNVFYSQIRCGILHQAQTKKQSIIHIKSGTPAIVWIEDADIQKGLSINRSKFHTEIEKAFNKYVTELRRGNDLNLRRKMERKMNFIASQT